MYLTHTCTHAPPSARAQVKEKWLKFLMMDLSKRPPPAQREELIVEGKLSKVQPLCTTNMTRWWQVTNRRIMYFKEEAGEPYGCEPNFFGMPLTPPC